MKVTLLGTGTSQGIPVIACDCDVCLSKNKKDKRLRTSAMIEVNNETFIIDTGPDFRQQMLREDVKDIDAVLFTHHHKDHVAGMDDVRAFNFKYKKSMDVYCDMNVRKALLREFPYVFSDNKYPGVPEVNIHQINSLKTFSIEDNLFTPIEVMHYKLPVLGFRVNDLTYITDAKTISRKEIDKIKGTRVLIVNALRIREHISHFNLKEALSFIDEVKPEVAYLTHVSHLMGKTEDVQKYLPDKVILAHDGLQVAI